MPRLPSERPRSATLRPRLASSARRPLKPKPCPESCSASAAASPRTSRSSSCAWRRRPGTRCGSCRRPTSQRFVGAASFAGADRRAGAEQRVRARPRARGLPRTAAPGARAAEPPGAGGATPICILIAPASANTLAKLAARPGGQPAEQLRAGRDLPAGGGAGDEQPHVRARRPPRPTCRRCASAASRSSSRAVGRLASKGEQGVGRLAEPARLLEACEAVLAAPASTPATSDRWDRRARGWRGLKVLVTAGGTREPIDSVRFIGNSSSGRMGFALAQAAHARGAEVTLMAANVALPRPPGVRLPRGRHRRRAAGRPASEEFPACDVLLMAAAVADFRPRAPAEGKIKKSGRASLELELEPTADVLAGSGRAAARRSDAGRLRRRARRARGRAAPARSSTEQGTGRGRRQRHLARGHRLRGGRQRGHDPDRGRRAAETVQHVPRAAKAEVAEAILDAVERLRDGADGADQAVRVTRAAPMLCSIESFRAAVGDRQRSSVPRVGARPLFLRKE